ncbi:Eukaryotic translation initiation factor 5A [Halotydeus destructor]|nr:Eukaryotic translation initiation factor 5A [Halotydeus destructor]
MLLHIALTLFVSLDFVRANPVSGTFRVRAGDLIKDGHMLIQGHPCKIVDIEMLSNRFKLINFVGQDIFTNETYQCSFQALQDDDDGALKSIALPDSQLGRSIKVHLELEYRPVLDSRSGCYVALHLLYTLTMSLDSDEATPVSGTSWVKAEDLRKDGHMLIQGHACKIVDIKVSSETPESISFEGQDVFTSEAYQVTFPAGSDVEVPEVTRKEYPVGSIDSECLVLEDNDEMKQVIMPESDLRNDIEHYVKCNVVYVSPFLVKADPVSGTSWVKAEELRKDGHMLIQGHPCKIVDIKIVSETPESINFEGQDMFTNETYQVTFPAGSDVEVPEVTRIEYLVASIDSNRLVVVEEDGDLKIMALPDSEMRRKIEIHIDYNPVVTVVSALGMEKVVSFRYGAPAV